MYRYPGWLAKYLFAGLVKACWNHNRRFLLKLPLSIPFHQTYQLIDPNLVLNIRFLKNGGLANSKENLRDDDKILLTCFIFSFLFFSTQFLLFNRYCFMRFVLFFHNFCRVFVGRINKILTPNNIEISQAHTLNLQIV